MRKIIGIIIAASMLAAAPSAMAQTTQTAAAQTSQAAGKMEEALAEVKNKITVPAELDKFTSNVYNDSEKGVTYEFGWTNGDGDAVIKVKCDEKGRILYYINQKDDYRRSDRQKLPSVTIDQAKARAEEFIKKLAPETVADENDKLVLSEDSVNNLYDGFSFRFERIKNGNKVKDNSAGVSINTADDELSVTRVSVNFDYDAVFENEAEEISAPLEKYKSVFPPEMVYAKIYSYMPAAKENTEDDNDIRLIYRIASPGYISAYTGEELKEDDNGAALYANEMTADAASAGGGASKSMRISLTPQEEEELKNISNLYTAEEAGRFLKSIPELKMGSDTLQTSANIYCTDTDKKEYSLSIRYKDGKNENAVSASFDAKRSRLTSIYNYGKSDYYSSYSEEKPLTEAQAEKDNRKIESFLNKVIGDKLGEFELMENKEDEIYNASRTYRRIVNNVPYIDNTIMATYNHNDEKISYYSLNYEDNAVFADPSAAMDADKAYEAMLKTAPVEKLYIYSGGSYKLAYAINGYPRIDAFTGEDIDLRDSFNPAAVKYSDISGHWCEEAVNALRDFGIAFEGGAFRPDETVTQADLLRFLFAGIREKSAVKYETDTIYEQLIREEIIAKDERNDEASVTREQAFIYMIRLMNYDEVAKLNDIYKIEYSDGDKLSQGTVGYAAILSGMGILCGDGGAIRPKDNITRAETASMIYKYLK